MPKTITLRYPATCADCGAELKAGDRAKWYGRGRIYGLTCHTGSAPARTSGLCPTCKVTQLTAREVRLGYQCSRCADAEEGPMGGGWGTGYDYQSRHYDTSGM